MLTQIIDGLWIGDIEECPIEGTPNDGAPLWIGILHACKAPCHQRYVGYKGSLPPTHREYLWADGDADLYLNLIDPPVPLFKRESFDKALDWLDKRLPLGPVLVHCNQGLSRAPSIALLWLAKRTDVLALDRGSFTAARQAFTETYCKDYAPGQGLVTFLTEQWGEIR